MIKNKLKEGILSKNKNVSNIQMTLTLILVFSLVISNIIVIKPIKLFGIPWLSNTCAIIMFPITYVLSDVFSEVYGYKWSRITATWALLGTITASMIFKLTIYMNGTEEWLYQEDLVNILDNSTLISFASALAFYVGDWINDIVFRTLKNKNKEKLFGFRAIASSIAGKYVDSFIFTFIGLNFLSFDTKINMVINDPIVHILVEIVLLPITYFIMYKLKRYESSDSKDTKNS